MSVDERNPAGATGPGANVRSLLEGWGESIAQVLESMTDQRPRTELKFLSGTPAEVGAGADDTLWWQQSFKSAPDLLAWVAAPHATWEFAGTLTLKAAGLETVEQGEAKNTWFEILGQSLAAMARAIGGLIGTEVACDTGAEQRAEDTSHDWLSLAMKFGENALPPVLVALSPKLIETISAPAPQDEASETGGAPSSSHAEPGAVPMPPSRTLELLMDVDLPISISFGKAQLPMKDVLKLTTGSIVELDRAVNAPVEILVNQCLIARGEVVVVEGNYGVRIQEIASRQDRMRSLK